MMYKNFADESSGNTVVARVYCSVIDLFTSFRQQGHLYEKNIRRVLHKTIKRVLNKT